MSNIVNRLLLKKLFISNVKRFEYPSFDQLTARIRNYSSYYNIIPQPKKSLEVHELEEYNKNFEHLVEFLITNENELPEEVHKHLKKVLNYNVPCNEQAMGPLVLLTYKYFARLEDQTPEKLSQAYIMGCVNDIVVSSIQISDDIMDLSKTRYNKPCWYLKKDVGMTVINDAVILSESTFNIIKNHVGQHPCYVSISELTQSIKFKFAIGQALDTMCNLHIESNLKFFTPEIYKILAKYKGSFLFLIDPVSKGMYLAEVLDQKLHSEVTSVLETLGEYFIAQNDILDCYGKPGVTGKYGTDISTGKCTWLAVRTLLDANSSQKELFQKNYGKSDLDSQEKIYNLYEELDILNKFLLHEETVYLEMKDMVEKMSESVPKELMYKIIDSFYGKI